MSDTELLIEEIKTLPASRVSEVLDFVEFVKQKESQNAKGVEDLQSDASWFVKGEECPICAQHRDPKTGEPLYNAETIAAIEEGDAMLRGERPANWHQSLDDLDKMLGL